MNCTYSKFFISTTSIFIFLSLGVSANADIETRGAYDASDKSLSYECYLGDTETTQKKFPLFVKGTDSPWVQIGEAKNVINSGDILTVKFDNKHREFSGQLTQGNQRQVVVSVDLLDAGFKGHIGSENYTCYTNHQEPSLQSMVPLATNLMKEIHDEVSEMNVTGNNMPAGATLGMIISENNIDESKTKCLRYHWEGDAISTLMCAQPTDDGRSLVIYKLGFEYQWDNQKKIWTPTLWGWDDDAGDPVSIPAQ